MTIERAPLEGRTHGKVGTYASGCRCPECKRVHSEWSKARYYANHEENKAEFRASYARNRPARLAAKRRQAYGITQEEWDLLFESQRGLCAVCGESPKGRTLNVDHNHRTGTVRGLLCSNCNTALGLLGDSEERIADLGRYLQRSPQCEVRRLKREIDGLELEIARRRREIGELEVID